MDITPNHKVICQICGSALKLITNSHLKQHQMTPAEYRERFPDSPMRSELVVRNHAAGAVVANSDPERRAVHSQRMSGKNNPFYGKTHSEETRARISAASKRVWNEEYERMRAVHQNKATGEDHHSWRGGPEVAYWEGRKGSEKWRSRRVAISAFGSTCMIPECDFDFIVHNHHIIPKSIGGSMDLHNCVLLCPNHHALADAGKISSDYLRELNKAALESF